MKNSLYEFGNTELAVRKSQEYFVNFFLNCHNVLDIGCGRGIFMKMLREKNINVFGVDESDESMTACKNKDLKVFKSEALEFLTKKRNVFDGIFCAHVIEHMDYNKACILISTMYNSLIKNGILVLATPNPASHAIMSNTFWLDPTHVRPYPALLLQSMLCKYKFKIIESGSIDTRYGFIGRMQWFFESLLNFSRTGANLHIIAKK